jgi:hypothetical protein
MAVETFVPMLESLSEILVKSARVSKGANHQLAAARLAPDMFTLAQQVQQACLYAENGVAVLTGRGQISASKVETTLAGLKAQIGATIAALLDASAAEFEGAEARDCSIVLPNDMLIEMDGIRFLRSWTLPHFYFHVVTAYDILRHSGISIGKMDYLSQAGRYVRPKAT